MFVMLAAPTLVAFGKFKVNVDEGLTFDHNRHDFRMEFRCPYKFVRLSCEVRRIALRFSCQDIRNGYELQCNCVPRIQRARTLRPIRPVCRRAAPYVHEGRRFRARPPARHGVILFSHNRIGRR